MELESKFTIMKWPKIPVEEINDYAAAKSEQLFLKVIVSIILFQVLWSLLMLIFGKYYSLLALPLL